MARAALQNGSRPTAALQVGWQAHLYCLGKDERFTLKVLLMHLLLLLCSLLAILCTLLCSNFPLQLRLCALLLCSALGHMRPWETCHECWATWGLGVYVMYASCLGVRPPLQPHAGAGDLKGHQGRIPASCFGVGRSFRGSVYTAHCGIRRRYIPSRRKDPEGMFPLELHHCNTEVLPWHSSKLPESHADLCHTRSLARAVNHLRLRRLQIAQGVSAWLRCCRSMAVMGAALRATSGALKEPLPSAFSLRRGGPQHRLLIHYQNVYVAPTQQQDIV